MPARTPQTAAEPVYAEDVSEIYDLFYTGRGKSFADEATAIERWVRARDPHASSVLDVACGTGEHLRCFAGRFPDVAGVELSPAMCAVARRKLPGVPVHIADMRGFDLGRGFDVVCCLTSTLGYMADVDELRRSVAAMAAHLRPGGVLIVDPWWSPGHYRDGYVAQDAVRTSSGGVIRMSRSTRDGDRVRNEAHYVVSDERGIRHFTHVQTLTLFTATEYLAAMRAAGLTAEHVEGLTAFPDRGLFAGRLG